MKLVKIIFLIGFLFCLAIIKIQARSIKGHVFLLTGKIIGKIELEISTFSDSTYKNKNIGVIVTCPELYGKDFFEVGKKYEIKVADENQASFSWSIPNIKLLETYRLKNNYWVIEAKKIE